MRIVSQKRDLSVDLGQCEVWMQDNVIYRRIGNDSKVIGVYATTERAAEVFEDIHKAYSPYGLICDKLSEEQIPVFAGSKNVRFPVIKIDESDCNITTYDSVVYYMPEV